jgi:hypothetical protein
VILAYELNKYNTVAQHGEGSGERLANPKELTFANIQKL